MGPGNGVGEGEMCSLLPSASAKKPNSLRAIKSTLNQNNADTVRSSKTSPASESTNMLTSIPGEKVLRAIA